MATPDLNLPMHSQSSLLTHPNTGLPLRFAFHTSITPGMQSSLGKPIALNGVYDSALQRNESAEDVNVLLVSEKRLGVPIQSLRMRYEGEGVLLEA